MVDLLAMLDNSPYTIKGTNIVRLTSFGDSSINILISAYLTTNVYATFLQQQNDLNLNIMDVMQADGIGRLDAVSNAVKAYLNMDFALTTYTEHALAVRSNSKAVSYVGLEKIGKTCWGVGIRADIINSSISAFLSALNQLITDCK